MLRCTKLEIDDILKNLNSEVVLDISNRFTKKEVDDKLTPINNKFDDYVTTTTFDLSLSTINASFNDRYTKTEVDNLLKPINEEQQH